MKPANRLPAAAGGMMAPTRLRVLIMNSDVAAVSTAVLRERNATRTAPVPRNGSARDTAPVMPLNQGSSNTYWVRPKRAPATM